MRPLRQLMEAFQPKIRTKKAKRALPEDTISSILAVFNDLEKELPSLLKEVLQSSSKSHLMAYQKGGINFIHLEAEQVGKGNVYLGGPRIVMLCQRDSKYDKLFLKWLHLFFASDNQDMGTRSHLKLSTRKMMGIFPESRIVDTMTCREGPGGDLVTRPTNVVTWTFLCDHIDTTLR